MKPSLNSQATPTSSAPPMQSSSESATPHQSLTPAQQLLKDAIRIRTLAYDLEFNLLADQELAKTSAVREVGKIVQWARIACQTMANLAGPTSIEV